MINLHFPFLLIIIAYARCCLIYSIDQKTIDFNYLIKVCQFVSVLLTSSIISLFKLSTYLDKTLSQIKVKSQSSFLLDYMHHDSLVLSETAFISNV